MTTPMDFRSGLAKYEWAQGHAKALRDDVLRWASRQGNRPIRFRREFHYKEGYVSFWVTHIRPPRASWSLMYGDAVVNFRAALDHIAWEIVRARGELPIKRPKQVRFPIYETDRTDFLRTTGKPGRELPSVPAYLRAVLSPFQPYEGRKDTHVGHTIHLLNELANTDKHREFLSAIVRPENYDLTFPKGAQVRVVVRDPDKPFQLDTEAVRIHIAPWMEPRPPVNVDFEPAHQVRVEGIPLLSSLEWFARTVGEVLRKVLTIKAR